MHRPTLLRESSRELFQRIWNVHSYNSRYAVQQFVADTERYIISLD